MPENSDQLTGKQAPLVHLLYAVAESRPESIALVQDDIPINYAELRSRWVSPNGYEFTALSGDCPRN